MLIIANGNIGRDSYFMKTIQGRALIIIDKKTFPYGHKPKLETS